MQRTMTADLLFRRTDDRWRRPARRRVARLAPRLPVRRILRAAEALLLSVLPYVLIVLLAQGIAIPVRQMTGALQSLMHEHVAGTEAWPHR